MKLLNNIRNYIHKGAYGNNLEFRKLLRAGARALGKSPGAAVGLAKAAPGLVGGLGGLALSKLLKKKRKKAQGSIIQSKRVDSPLSASTRKTKKVAKAGIIRRPGLTRKKPY